MFQEFHTINLLQKFNILSKRYDTNTGAFQYFQTQSMCLFYLSTLFQFPFILITVFLSWEPQKTAVLSAFVVLYSWDW